VVISPARESETEPATTVGTPGHAAADRTRRAPIRRTLVADPGDAGLAATRSVPDDHLGHLLARVVRVRAERAARTVAAVSSATIQRKLIVADEPITDPSDIARRLGLTDYIASIDKLVRSDTVYGFTTPELFADAVEAAYKKDSAEQVARLQAHLPGAESDPPPPWPIMLALNDFFDAHPGFTRYLRRTDLTFDFHSRAAVGYGGGLFKDGRVNIWPQRIIQRGHGLDQRPLEPTAFVRLVLHELGHATFQRMLAENAEDDRAFREAWETLANVGTRGAAMQGVEVGSNPASHRRPYQANKYDEFCAEMFMLGLTDRHLLVAASTNPELPVDVRKAWQGAREILDAYTAGWACPDQRPGRDLKHLARTTDPCRE
jgi:hypothetical protein